MRRVGIEDRDLFGFVENLQRAVQLNRHLDSSVTVRTKGRGLGNLQDGPFEGNRMVLATVGCCLKRNARSI